MTDETPEDAAFAADLDRLRAQLGAAALAEAQRRGIGDDMWTDALLRVMDANELERFRGDISLWSRPAEEGWDLD